MLQLLQNLANGDLNLAPAPCQCPAAGHFLLASRASLISAGTGSMLLEFGLANWISKARQQPDKAVPSPPR